VTTGRIDVHSHLLPGVDDGCKTLSESIECARALVSVGYTHAFCTPHIWPAYANSIPSVKKATAALQEVLQHAEVPLRLLCGGEMNLHPAVLATPADQIITMALAKKYMLVDMWAEAMPKFFEPAIKWLQGMGLTVILAHPERMRAVQDDTSLADRFAAMGILLQGNLQCFADRPGADTRRVAEQYLKEGRYFLLGSDSHNPPGMPTRLEGLQRAIAVAGEEAVNKLTIENPRKVANFA